MREPRYTRVLRAIPATWTMRTAARYARAPGTREGIKDEAARIEFERRAIWPWEENPTECNIRAVVPATAFFFGRNGGKWQGREKDGWMDGSAGDEDGDVAGMGWDSDGDGDGDGDGDEGRGWR